MTFTHQELMELLQELVVDYLHGHIDSAFEVTRENLENMPESRKWFVRNGISLLIENGHLFRVSIATQDTPFSCQLTERGIKAINGLATIGKC